MLGNGLVDIGINSCLLWRRPNNFFFAMKMTSTTEIHVARLAQSVEHQTFNLRVMGSSPLLGASFFFLRLQRQGTHLGLVNFFPFWASTSATFLWVPWQQRGAVEACWAHNPEVDGSKPSAARFFFVHWGLFIFHISLFSFANSKSPVLV